MPSSYTSNLRLTLPVQGELSGTWGDTVNTGITALTDTAIAGTAAVTMTDADYTLTSVNGAADQARSMFVTLTGTLTADRNVIVPASSKLYFVTNNTTGGFALTVKTSAGTGISVPNGKRMALYCNATNVLNAFDVINITGGTITGITDLAIADGGTGASTAIDALINLGERTGATGSVKIATGTTAQRDGTPAAGYFRFNSTNTQFEGYNGSAWSLLADSAGTVLTTTDQTVAGTKTFTSSPTVPGINGGQLAGMRNKIINGNFNIAQRGTSGTSANTYCLDRWISFYGGTATTWSQVAGGSLVDVYFSSLLQIAGAAGNTGVTIAQRIESYNSADLCGKTVTLSVYVLQTTGATAFPGLYIQRPNTKDNWSVSTLVAASGAISVPNNTWTRITFTTTLPASGPELGLSFEIGTGALGAAQGFYFTGAQLEIGSVATPFEHRPYGTELALCQRYYETGSYLAGYYWNNTWGGTGRYDQVTFVVPKRASPLVGGTFSGAGWTGAWSTSSITSTRFLFSNNATTNIGNFTSEAVWNASAEL